MLSNLRIILELLKLSWATKDLDKIGDAVEKIASLMGETEIGKAANQFLDALATREPKPIAKALVNIQLLAIEYLPEGKKLWEVIPPAPAPINDGGGEAILVGAPGDPVSAEIDKLLAECKAGEVRVKAAAPGQAPVGVDELGNPIVFGIIGLIFQMGPQIWQWFKARKKSVVG